MSNHYETRHDANGVSYIAKLAESGAECREIVFADGVRIHYAEFETRLIGDAKRGDYLEAMARTIIRCHQRGAL
ncbi:hypothetical protein [Sphingomonas sp.]|uniref:hypothetical protein n=1 Tax=Sphingomonas sp. TaxID=28214 RepID=UPI002EDAB8F5